MEVPVTMNVPKRLQSLDKRLAARFSHQPETPDLLPPIGVDLSPLTTQRVPKLEQRADGRRSNMLAQQTLLTRSFANRFEIELLHGLVISYLRRDTPHTKKAWALFRRIWTEQSEFMVATLTARWIISALQTFYDHSEVPAERTAGGIGFTYGNLIKAYETEHTAVRRNRTPDLKNYKNKSVPGMFGFVPGDDILININVVVLDAAKSGGIAAAPLMRLLEIIAEGDTLFQRTDALGTIEPFSEHPSFTYSFDGRK